VQLCFSFSCRKYENHISDSFRHFSHSQYKIKEQQTAHMT